jgi:hypothetical protein
MQVLGSRVKPASNHHRRVTMIIVLVTEVGLEVAAVDSVTEVKLRAWIQRDLHCLLELV